jgi:rhodanese-related sulfurtransferase
LNAQHLACVLSFPCNNNSKFMKKRSLTYWILTAFAFATSIQLGIASPAENETKPLKAGYHEIKSKKAGQLLKKHKDLIVLDIRTEKEYVAGHIAKAKHVDFTKMILNPAWKNSIAKLLTWCIALQAVAADVPWKFLEISDLRGSTT